MKKLPLHLSCFLFIAATACNNSNIHTVANGTAVDKTDTNGNKYISQPLVSHIYTADPSAHVFNNRIYIYPSHDTATGMPENDEGDHFDMKDYHVLSMDAVGGKVTDHGVALSIKDIPWAGRQLWAPDAAYANGKYYLYFPAKNKQDVFRIGVAVSDKPEGPFKAEPEPIPNSYSMDPAVLADDDGSYYMYFGGIWGGQLHRWDNNVYHANADKKKGDETATLPRIAKLNKDMLSFAEPVKEIKIVDKDGNLFKEKDNDKRFFEAPWVHKYKGKYYLSYFTGDTHNICYAISDNPYGPFTYQGVIMYPVEGWTCHHSIAAFKGKWYMFYHDIQLSGKTYLRNAKMTELTYNADGTIVPIKPMK